MIIKQKNFALYAACLQMSLPKATKITDKRTDVLITKVHNNRQGFRIAFTQLTNR